MSESWHVGRVTQVSSLSVHAARFHGRKGLLKAPVRSEGRFPLYLLGLTLGSFTVGFNGSYPRWTEAYGVGAHRKRPSPGDRARSILWFAAVLVIGLTASPCCSGWVALAVANEGRPARATSANSTARAVRTGEDTDRGACALLEKTPSPVSGVLRARVNFESKHAQVEHELRRIHPGRVSEVIIAARFGVPPNPTRGALTTPAPHRVLQPALTELSAEAEPLRSGFNRDASSTRLLLILSPS